MAGPRRGTRRTTVEEELQDDATDASDETEALLNESEDGQRPPDARIHRLDPTTRRLALLDVLDANTIDDAFMRENYGGGEYRVLFYGIRKDKRWGYLRTKTYRVDSTIPFKGSIRDRSERGAVAVVNPPGHANGEDADMKMLFKSELLNLIKEQNENRGTAQTMLAGMMSQMQNNSQQFMTVITNLLTQSQRPTPSGLGEFKEILGPLISGAVNKKDPMEIASAMVALMKPDTNLRDMLGMMRELKDTSDEFSSPRGDPDDKWLDLIGKIAPGVVDVLKAESAKTGRPLEAIARPTVRSPHTVGVAPSAAPALGAAPSPAPEPVAVPDEWTPLEPYMAQLAQMASQNKDPYGVMQTILTLAPAEMIAAIRELVAKPDAVAILVHRFPALASAQAWTTQLVEEFRDELFGGDEDGGESDDFREDEASHPGVTVVAERARPV